MLNSFAYSKVGSILKPTVFWCTQLMLVLAYIKSGRKVQQHYDLMYPSCS